MTYNKYAAIPGINFSTLKHMAESPKAYRASLEDPKPSTADQEWLSYQHAAILEPHNIDRDYVLWNGGLTQAGKPTTSANSTAYKEAAAQAKASGQTLLNAVSDSAARKLAAIESLARACRSDPWLGPLLAHPDTVTEYAVQGADAITGATIKCRVDLYNPTLRIWADLKGYGTTDARQVGQLIAKGKAAHQAAMNRRCILAAGLPVPADFYIVSLDPGLCDLAAYRVPDDVLEQADADITDWLTRVLECRAADHWPGAQPQDKRGESPVLPAWYCRADDTHTPDPHVSDIMGRLARGESL